MRLGNWIILISCALFATESVAITINLNNLANELTQAVTEKKATSSKINTKPVQKKVTTKKVKKKSSSNACEYAGYTQEQAKSLNNKCLGLEDLKPYMSSNTYMGLTLGTPIKNYKGFTRRKHGKWESRDNAFQHVGVIYTRYAENKRFYVLTRFGLIDTVVVKLGKLDKEVVLNKLREKYSLISDKKYYKRYHQFPKIEQSGWYFRNDEDSIMYFSSGTDSCVIIYTSSAYELIDVLVQEKQEIKKAQEQEKKNNTLNSL